MSSFEATVRIHVLPNQRGQGGKVSVRKFVCPFWLFQNLLQQVRQHVDLVVFTTIADEFPAAGEENASRGANIPKLRLRHPRIDFSHFGERSIRGTHFNNALITVIWAYPSAVIGSLKNICVCRVRRAQEKVRPRQSLQSHPRKSVVLNLACRGISKDTKYIVSDGYAPQSSERTMGLFLRRA